MKQSIDHFSTFPQRVQDYLQDILRVVKAHDIILVSIVLFGSLAKGGYKDEISDVDLVFILDDSHNKRDKNTFDAIITKLEYKHGFRERKESKIDALYSIAENMTGMFISHFICFEKDYRDSRFDKVFNVNPILSFLLAPSAIVWNSVVSSSKTIWGDNLKPHTRPVLIKSVHVIKSLLMNLLLNILAYATYLLHSNSTKFSMEALKWSIHSCYFCLEKQSTSVEEAISFFSSKLDGDEVFDNMLQLRNNYQQTSIFIRKATKMIIRLHLFTLHNVTFPQRVKI